MKFQTNLIKKKISLDSHNMFILAAVCIIIGNGGVMYVGF